MVSRAVRDLGLDPEPDIWHPQGSVSLSARKGDIDRLAALVQSAIVAQLAAQQTGATTEPERVADAAAEIPFWLHDPRGLG